jgi:hypothetical protein
MNCMGCETCFLVLKEEHRLRVFVNTVLRRICGPKREKFVGGWRRLHNEEFRNLYACALSEHHAMEARWGSEGIAPLIL